MKMQFAAIVAACLMATSSAYAATVPGAIPEGWAYQGHAGTGTADGVVGGAPSGDDYLYVSTAGSTKNSGEIKGYEFATKNGSVLVSDVFSAQAGQTLDIWFNYVTTDGKSYADYGWSRLLTTEGYKVATLYTARTVPFGHTVPGYFLPGVDATLTPGSAKTTKGTEWSALGDDSGKCYGKGCGSTGWIKSSFTFDYAGDYLLAFGVTNLFDDEYDTGLAVAGISIDGKPMIPAPVPLPAAGFLLAAGLGGLALMRRKRA